MAKTFDSITSPTLHLHLISNSTVPTNPETPPTRSANDDDLHEDDVEIIDIVGNIGGGNIGGGNIGGGNIGGGNSDGDNIGGGNIGGGNIGGGNSDGDNIGGGNSGGGNSGGGNRDNNERLSSVASSRSSSRLSSSSSSSGSVSEEDDDCRLIDELEKTQRSLGDKMRRLGKILKRRKRRKLNLEDSEADPNVSKEGQSGSQSVSESLASMDMEQTLKRKLKMVTAELCRSRMDQGKKLRKAAVRDEMVIDVPDFPMEFYNEKVESNIRFGKLGDWYRHFNKCLHFQRRKPEYIEWIQNRLNDFLPDVLKIICTVWNKDVKPGTGISGSDLLKCRLVSRSWKASIDQFLQKRSREHHNNAEDNMAVVCTNICSTNCIKFSNMVCNLGTSSQATGSHPFPSRHLELSARPLKTVELTGRFKGSMDILLHLYGGELHCFSYNSYPDPLPDTRNAHGASILINGWLTVRQWLEKMKELRRLQLSLPYSAEAELQDGSSLSTWQHVIACPFPFMSNLTTIECRHVPGILVDSMLSANKQVRKFQVFQLSGQPHPNWETHSHLPQLFDFSINVLKMEHVEPLRFVQWPLRKLTLSTSGIIEDAVYIDKLFEILENFKETLTHLHLSVWVYGSVENNLSLRLPHLKHIWLELLDGYGGDKISYDFLLPLTKLETLKIVLEREYSAEELVGGNVVQVIQLRGYLNHLYDSNIWTLFPGMKNICAVAYYGEDSSPKEFNFTRHEFTV